MTKLEIMADYHQIYIRDAAREEDWSSLWTDQTVADRIVALPHTVVFGVGRNMVVPVDVVAHLRAPDLASMTEAADHAVQAGIACVSGAVIVAGCTDYAPDAFSLRFSSGPLGVAFLSYDLGTIDPVDGLEGDDRYALHIWPAATVPAVRVLKRWAPRLD
ncbi:MAG: hypothetical protein U1E19_03305 [Rhodoblastus sp.]